MCRGPAAVPARPPGNAFPSSRLTWASFSGGAGGGSATCWDERWAAWAQDSGRLDVSGESFLAIRLLPGPGAKPGAGGAFFVPYALDLLSAGGSTIKPACSCSKAWLPTHPLGVAGCTCPPNCSFVRSTLVKHLLAPGDSEMSQPVSASVCGTTQGGGTLLLQDLSSSGTQAPHRGGVFCAQMSWSGWCPGMFAE